MSIRSIGWAEVLSVFTATNLALYGYLIFGMIAVTYVVEVFLVYVCSWVAWQIYREYREELLYKYRLSKALNQWKERR
jgi:hypothetical protein